MKRLWLGCLTLALALPLSAESVVGDQQVDQLTAEARGKTKAFMMQLKGTLKKEMKSNGPVSAIQVCNVKAPEIAKAGSDSEWQVSRTSSKVRNPQNQPTQWQSDVLTQFENQLAQGVDPKTVEYTEVVGNEFRYMKAIPTGQVCLACHGSDLKPAVQTKIDQLYPDDQATGFSVGQLRGAFVLKKTF